MRHIVRTLVVCLIAFTALAMAFQPWFKELALGGIGPFTLYPFDALLLASAGMLLYAISLRPPIDPYSRNRVVLRLVGAYLAYQVGVVATVAFLAYHRSSGEIFLGLDARLALLFIPFFYYLGLRYFTAATLVALVNVAAGLLLLYALYRYVVIGPQGYWDGSEYRLRVLWGGSTLLFGWMAVTGLFLEKPGLRAYAVALAGILGIALENHRSGYMALVLALAYQTLSTLRIGKRVVLVACALVIVWASLSTVSPALRASASYSLRTMFNPHADVTASDRVQRSALAWHYVVAHPLGDYVWTHTLYLVDLGTDGFEPHNFVIQTLDKQGVVVAGLIFALIVYVMVIGWSIRRRSRLAGAMTAYLVFYLAFCLFNTNFDSVENVTLFALAVALVLYANKDSRPLEASAAPYASLPIRTPAGARVAHGEPLGPGETQVGSGI